MRLPLYVCVCAHVIGLGEGERLIAHICTQASGDLDAIIGNLNYLLHVCLCRIRLTCTCTFKSIGARARRLCVYDQDIVTLQTGVFEDCDHSHTTCTIEHQVQACGETFTNACVSTATDLSRHILCRRNSSLVLTARREVLEPVGQIYEIRSQDHWIPNRHLRCASKGSEHDRLASVVADLLLSLF